MKKVNIVVTLLAVVLVGFVDEDSIWHHIKNKQYINELQEEIDHYTELNRKNKEQIDMLNRDPKAIQKIARERYFMKADDEDIFVLSDDNQDFSLGKLYLLGGLLMVVGSGAYVLLQSWAPTVFCVGCILFVAMQLRQKYSGSNVAIRRLRRMLMLSDVFFLAAGFLMVANQNNFLGLDQLTYIKYVHNNWVVVLLVAAILQLYASHRIANELEKEAKKR